MEQTLKITKVLSDPTRYYIYQFITKKHRDVSVQEIAENFSIHPNVARVHLTKLEDANMLVSEKRKTGKGGRPSRLYRLSNDVVQLHFPFRDYLILSKIAMETMVALGEAAQKALYDTGKRFGLELIEEELSSSQKTLDSLSFSEIFNILKNASTLAGLTPEYQTTDEDKTKVYFQVYNCPFKEIANDHIEDVCRMHIHYLKGMSEALFNDNELIEGDNIIRGCESCTYKAIDNKVIK